MSENRLPIADLAAHALRGLSWGLAARQLDNPMRKESEIEALPNSLPEGAREAVDRLFTELPADISLLDHADAAVDAFPDLEDLREYLIDLCVLRIIDEGSERDGEEFLEGPEWEKIEAKTEDRGTELLNVMVYLRDCGENQVDPNLDDFLQEFLMVSDEDFQEELQIYEDFIRHQELVDGSLKQLVQTGNNLRDADMQEIFTPVMLFFKDRELKPGKMMLHLLNESRIPELHAALYLLLTGFFLTGMGASSPEHLPN